MRTREELHRLEDAAQSWNGTPFCENSRIKHSGVCCHAAVLEVLFEAGWMERFDYPMLPMRTTSPQRVDEAFYIEARGKFKEVGRASSRAEIEPGDILVLKLGRTCHFVLVLDGGRFFHAPPNIGARIAPSLQASWLERCVGHWRIA